MFFDTEIGRFQNLLKIGPRIKIIYIASAMMNMVESVIIRIKALDKFIFSNEKKKKELKKWIKKKKL